MKALACVLLVAGAACGERALDSIDPPAPAPACGAPRSCHDDAGAALAVASVCPSLSGVLEVEAMASTLGFCHCLHGCGLGIDGTIALLVTNHGVLPRTLVLNDVFFTNDEGTVHYEDSGLSSSPGLGRSYRCDGEAAPFAGVIAPGAVDRLELVEHFDVGSSAPGPYRARAQLAVDGQLAWFELGEMMLRAPAACN